MVFYAMQIVLKLIQLKEAFDSNFEQFTIDT